MSDIVDREDVLEGEEEDAMDEEFEEIEIDLDPEFFVSGVLLFPAFKEANAQMPVDDLFALILNAYRDEQLTEEQDLIVELMVHLHEENSPFNLKRAREIWTEEDMNAFFKLIKL